MWLALSLLGASAEATRDFAGKRLMNQRLSPLVVAWASMVFALPFFIAMLAFAGIPKLGPFFWPAMLGQAALYAIGVSLQMSALKASEMSLALPMLAFTPVFMLFTGPIVLREMPNALGIIGIAVVVAGAYLLRLEEIKNGWWRPFYSLLKDPGPRLMLIVALIYAGTSVLLKLSVLQSSRECALAYGFGASLIMMTAFMLWKGRLSGREITINWKSLTALGFLTALTEIAITTALASRMAVYVFAVKRTSILFGSIYGFKFFLEKDALLRSLGVIVMIAGVVLITLGK